MPTDDPAMQNALEDYNNQLAKSRDRNRRLSGLAICAAAAISWGIAAFAALSVLTDPKLGADFDSGTHTRDIAGAGWTAAGCAVLGVVLLIVAVWRGPKLIRWIGSLMLLAGVPLLWLTSFVFFLSQ